MRVVVAPDSFGGTLSATEAAAAIAEGWRRAAPGDELQLLPLADGGTGFLAVLQSALGGTLHETTSRARSGPPSRPRWLQVGDTAYVESAAACGLHLVPRAQRDPGGRGGRHHPRGGRAAGGGASTAGARRDRRRAGRLGHHRRRRGHARRARRRRRRRRRAAAGRRGRGAARPSTRLDGQPDAGRGRGSSPRPTSTTRCSAPHGAAAVFGPQKGADDAAVADAGRRAGPVRRRARRARSAPTCATSPGPAPPAVWARRCSRCGGGRVSGAGLVRRAGRAGRRAATGRAGRHRRGQLRLAVAARQAGHRRRHGPPPTAGCRAWCWPAR